MLSHSAARPAGVAVAGGQGFPLAWGVAGAGATGAAAAVVAATTTTAGTAGGTATWRATIAATGETVPQAGLWPAQHFAWSGALVLSLVIAGQPKLQQVVHLMPGCAPHGCQSCVRMPALLLADALLLKGTSPCHDAFHIVDWGGSGLLQHALQHPPFTLQIERAQITWWPLVAAGIMLPATHKTDACCTSLLQVQRDWHRPEHQQPPRTLPACQPWAAQPEHDIPRPTVPL